MHSLKLPRAAWRSMLVATIATLLMAGTVLAAPPGTNTQGSEAAACASLFGVPSIAVLNR